MGLACITKNQYAFFILPSLLVNWIADMLWYRQRGASLARTDHNGIEFFSHGVPLFS